MVSPAQKKQAVAYVFGHGFCSERRACRYLGVPRSTFRYPVKLPQPHQVQLHQRIVALSRHYPRYGYRRACRPRRRIATVWTWDFIFDRTDKGSTLKMLTMLDEYTRQCLAIRVERQIRSGQVLATLWQAMMTYGIPEHIRSDNGSEFIAQKIQEWLKESQIQTLYIDPGSPWQNGYIESFHSRFRDECLNREWLLNLREARVVIEDWRQYYNIERLHSRLGYLSPEGFIANQNVSL